MDLFKKNMNGRPEIARSCIPASNPNDLAIWPYYFVAQFKKWTAEGSNVGLLGDAAQAIPATDGQGSYMAIEGCSMFALLLSRLSTRLSTGKAANWCQKAARDGLRKFWS